MAIELLQVTWMPSLIAASAGVAGALVGGHYAVSAQREAQAAVTERERTARKEREGRVRALLYSYVRNLRIELLTIIDDGGYIVIDVEDCRKSLALITDLYDTLETVLFLDEETINLVSRLRSLRLTLSWFENVVKQHKVEVPGASQTFGVSKYKIAGEPLKLLRQYIDPFIGLLTSIELHFYPGVQPVLKPVRTPPQPPNV